MLTIAIRGREEGKITPTGHEYCMQVEIGEQKGTFNLVQSGLGMGKDADRLPRRMAERTVAFKEM